MAGKYVVGRVLGKPGGFGITYLCYDVHLETRVAIKELMPRELVHRDGSTLKPQDPDTANLFKYTLDQFLEEGQRLATIGHHPNIDNLVVVSLER